MMQGDLPRRVATDTAPRPGGHYVQACGSETMLFVSGQLPVSRDGAARGDASFEEQVRLALSNLLAIVEAGGSRRDLILKVTAFIVGVENWPEFNRVYAEMIGAPAPARSVVPVSALHYGCLVELEAIAMTGPD